MRHLGYRLVHISRLKALLKRSKSKDFYTACRFMHQSCLRQTEYSMASGHQSPPDAGLVERRWKRVWKKVPGTFSSGSSDQKVVRSLIER